MARVGGRNTAFAWIVGLVCLAAVGALAYLALPLFPATVAWLGIVADPTSEPVAEGEEGAGGAPAECRALYVDPLWASLTWTPDAVLTPSTDAPLTTAAGLVDALQPSVRLTCAWTSVEGTISTTFADVAPDAGSIARTALPAAGFTCEAIDDRTRCTRTDGETVETIETGGGLWLSTSQTTWSPAGYTSRTAEQIWPEDAASE